METARILIVDDEADHLYLLAAALQESLPGIGVSKASSLEEALTKLEDEEFDAVLCDYCLGGASGLQLLKATKRLNLELPILLVTNHGSEEVARQAFLEGVADYVTKETAFQNPADLARKVRRALEKKKLRKEKHKAEAILASFLDNNPYGILIVNPEGRIVRWNRALARINKHPRDLARIRDSYSLFADPQLQETGVLQLIEQAQSGHWVEIPPFPWDPARANLHGPSRIFRGVVFPIAIEGEEAPHLCAMIQDVSEEEKARRERDEYAAILARLLDATEAAIFFVEPDLSVRFANRHVGSFFGVDPQSLVGQPKIAFSSEIARSTSDPEAFLRRLTYLYEHFEEESEDEIDLVYPLRRHLRRHSGPVRDGAGRLLGRIEVYVDQTETVERNQLLEAQNRELDAFASRLAHDLKTPLVSLKGFVDLFQRQYAGGLDQRAGLYLEKIRSSAAILGEMVDGLRELAHASEEFACPTGVDPVPILRLVAEALAGGATERGIEVSLPSSSPMVECDRAKLFQIFQNLLSNAIRYCDPGKPRRWVNVEVLEDGQEVIIRVSDNGLGMDNEEITDVFRPFRRGRTAAGKPGMGLGLAIVQRIAQVCGGRVEAKSQQGEGSTFSVVLPRSG